MKSLKHICAVQIANTQTQKIITQYSSCSVCSKVCQKDCIQKGNDLVCSKCVFYCYRCNRRLSETGAFFKHMCERCYMDYMGGKPLTRSKIQKMYDRDLMAYIFHFSNISFMVEVRYNCVETYALKCEILRSRQV